MLAHARLACRSDSVLARLPSDCNCRLAVLNFVLAHRFDFFIA